jgi:hypothetical protein
LLIKDEGNSLIRVACRTKEAEFGIRTSLGVLSVKFVTAFGIEAIAGRVSANAKMEGYRLNEQEEFHALRLSSAASVKHTSSERSSSRFTLLLGYRETELLTRPDQPKELLDVCSQTRGLYYTELYHVYSFVFASLVGKLRCLPTEAVGRQPQPTHMRQVKQK